MKKLCVFCGSRPTVKSKEHVLPRWLLELTGDPKRTLKLALPYKNPLSPVLNIPFDSFHFAACEICNNSFGELENKAKCVVEAMLHDAVISAEDVSVLLDWLDKVRVGLWLGFLALENNPFNISPSFRISSRVATKDRLVSIYRANDQRLGIQFIGVDVPLFHHFPSCFTLVINGLYLLNMSADFLLARRLGFPFPNNAVVRRDGMLEANVVSGRERIMIPPLRLPLRAGGVSLFQPMFFNEVFAETPSIYDTDFVRRSSLNWERGIGLPHVSSNGRLAPYPSAPSLDWRPTESFDRYTIHETSIRQTLRLQADLWGHTYEFEDDEMKALVKRVKSLNIRMARMPIDDLSGLTW